MDNKLSNTIRRQVVESVGIAGPDRVFGVSSMKEFIGTVCASEDKHPAGDEQLPHDAFDSQSNRVVLYSISPRW